MNTLAELPLQSTRRPAAALSEAEIADLKKLLSRWDLTLEQHVPRLSRTFHFRDFAAAMHFANTIATLAGEADHHPALQVEWGKVSASWWTHSVEGLHINDFIMAAKCDAAYESFVTPAIAGPA
jgi:4a-hydroxytetrahydrobiopterin dehydratase